MDGGRWRFGSLRRDRVGNAGGNGLPGNRSVGNGTALLRGRRDLARELGRRWGGDFGRHPGFSQQARRAEPSTEKEHVGEKPAAGFLRAARVAHWKTFRDRENLACLAPRPQFCPGGRGGAATPAIWRVSRTVSLGAGCGRGCSSPRKGSGPGFRFLASGPGSGFGPVLGVRGGLGSPAASGGVSGAFRQLGVDATEGVLALVGSGGEGTTLPATAGGGRTSSSRLFARSPAAVRPAPRKSMSARKRRRDFLSRGVLMEDSLALGVRRRM